MEYHTSQVVISICNLLSLWNRPKTKLGRNCYEISDYSNLTNLYLYLNKINTFSLEKITFYSRPTDFVSHMYVWWGV